MSLIKFKWGLKMDKPKEEKEKLIYNDDWTLKTPRELLAKKASGNLDKKRVATHSTIDFAIQIQISEGMLKQHSKFNLFMIAIAVISIAVNIVLVWCN